MPKKSDEPIFEITEEIAPIQDGKGGNWNIEVNKVSWNQKPPQCDIRWWDHGGQELKAGKGISLSDEATENLVLALLKNGFGDAEEVQKILRERD